MLTVLMILAIIVAIVMMGSVLVQNPKGSGLAANFSSGNQFFGVKKTTDIIEKITWFTATIVLVISLVASAYAPKASKDPVNPGASGGNNIDPELEEIMQKGQQAPNAVMPNFDESDLIEGEDPMLPPQE